MHSAKPKPAQKSKQVTQPAKQKQSRVAPLKDKQNSTVQAPRIPKIAVPTQA